MKEYKNIPNNKRYYEGSIAESSLVDESVRHAMECMPNASDGNHKASWEDFLDPDSDSSETGPMLEGKKVILSHVKFVQIRRWVLFKINPAGLAENYQYVSTAPYLFLRVYMIVFYD